ncbi:MAG: HEAT repeat domain-containing protein [Candidatus Omnitrophica bacterium]|nr:HEAT repeat domain-containing protein [Candidatus Omnitrophota bacterium]
MKKTALCLAAALALSGCVKRAILIETDPPGADVLINGHRAGVTPLKYDFITHGRYKFVINKSGFHEITAREWVKAPWHQWIPLDFFTELLIPYQFDDLHRFQYALKPQKPIERISGEPPPRVEDLIITLRGSPDPQRRREACVLMARHHLTGGIAALEDATRDSDAEVRATALHALRVLHGKNALPFLITTLENDPHATVRWQAAAEIEALNPPGAYSALVKAADDPDPIVRAGVVEALRGLANPSAVPVVGRRLSDSDIVVRRSAADALGKFGDKQAADYLIRGLRDPDPEVRRRSAKSLLRLQAPEASEALARALKDTDPQVRAAAIDALGQFGTPEAVPIALRYVHAWHPATREAAASALGRMKDARAVPVLEEAVLREPNQQTREAMESALVALRGVAQLG